MKRKKNNSNYFDFGSYLDIYNYNNSGRRDLNKERKMAALKSAGDDSYKKYLNKFLSEMGKNIMNNRSSFNDALNTKTQSNPTQASQSNFAQSATTGNSALSSSPTATSGTTPSFGASGRATAGTSGTAGSAGGNGGGGGGAGGAIAGPAIIASAKITSKIYDLINGLANYNKKEEPMYLGLGGNLFADTGAMDIKGETNIGSDNGSMGGFDMESIIKMFGGGNKQGQQQQQPGGMDLLGSIEKPTMAVVNDIAGIVNSAKAINVPYKKTTFNDVSTYEDLSRKFSEGPAKINKDYYQKISPADWTGNNLREAAEGAEAFGAGGQWGAIGGAIGGGVTQIIRDGVYNWVTVPRARRAVDFRNKQAEEEFNRGVIGTMDYLKTQNLENAKNYITNASGGFLNKFAEGGNLNTAFTSGATEFNSGGTHEENPNGGIPQGKDSNETPNYVEEGEVKWNNYIFSNRIVIDKDALQRFMLPRKYNGKTIADVSKGIKAELEERPNDVISKRGVDKSLERLIQAQEFMKLKEEAAKFGMSPEEYQQALIAQQQLEIQQQTGGQEQPVQQAQQEQPAVDEQQALLEEIMNEQYGNESAMMKLGGYLAEGGPLDGDPKKKFTPVSQDEVVSNWLKKPEYKVVQSMPTYIKKTDEQKYRAEVDRRNKASEEYRLANAHTDQDKALQWEQIIADRFARTFIPNAVSFYSDMSPDEYSKLQELSSEERDKYIRDWNLKQSLVGRGSKNPELNQLLTSLTTIGDIQDIKFFDYTDPIDYAAYIAGFLLPGTPGFFKRAFKSDIAKKLYKKIRKLNLPKKETKRRVLKELEKIDLDKIDNPIERDHILQDRFPFVDAKSEAGRKAAFEYALANPTDKKMKKNSRLAAQKAALGTPIPKGTPSVVKKAIKSDRRSQLEKWGRGVGKTLLGAAGLTAIPYGAAVINDAMNARYLGDTEDDGKEFDLKYLFENQDQKTIQRFAKRHGMSEEELIKLLNYKYVSNPTNKSERTDSARLADIYYETPTRVIIEAQIRDLGQEGYKKDEIIKRLTDTYGEERFDIEKLVDEVSKSNGNLWELIQFGSPITGYKESKAMGGFLFDQPTDSKKAGNYFSGKSKRVSFEEYLKNSGFSQEAYKKLPLAVRAKIVNDYAERSFIDMDRNKHFEKVGIFGEDYAKLSSREQTEVANNYIRRLFQRSLLDKDWDKYIKENGKESFPDFLSEFANVRLPLDKDWNEYIKENGEESFPEFSPEISSENNKTDEQITTEFNDMLGRAIPEAHKIVLEGVVNDIDYPSGKPKEFSFKDYLKKMGIAREDYYRFSSEKKERIRNGYNVRLSLDKDWNEYIKENREESFPDFLSEFANEKINAEFNKTKKTDKEIYDESDEMLGSRTQEVVSDYNNKAADYFSGEPKIIPSEEYLEEMGFSQEDYEQLPLAVRAKILNGYAERSSIDTDRNESFEEMGIFGEDYARLSPRRQAEVAANFIGRLSLDKDWNEYIKEIEEESFPEFSPEILGENNKTDEQITAEFKEMLGRAIPEAHKIALESLVNKQETNPNTEKFFTTSRQNKDNDVNNAYRKAPIYNAIRNLLTQDPATGEYGEQIKSLYTPLIAENIGKHMGYTPIDFNQITSLQRAKQNAQIQNVMRNAGAAAPYLLAQINASRTGQEASNYIQGLEYNERKKNEALQYNTNIDKANAAERARIAELNLANRNNLYLAGIQAIEEEKRAVEDTIAHNWNALAENLSLYGKENENFDIVKNNPGLLYGTKGDYKGGPSDIIGYGHAYGGLLNKDNNKVYGSLDKIRAFMDMFDENIKKRKRS